MKNKLIACMISITLVLSMVPVLGASVHAEKVVPAIDLVQNGDASYIVGGQKSSIWYGDYLQSRKGSEGFNDDPVKWRVLSNDNATGRLFLLSDMGLDCRKYNDDHLGTTWKKCALRSWLNSKDSDDSFINSAFSKKEQSAILTTDVDNPGYVTPGDHRTKDQIFLLSIAESANESYGFATDYQKTETRQVENTEYTKSKNSLQGNDGKGYWWLRSPSSESANQAATVLDDGVVYRSGYSADTGGIAVRPVFNLDLGSAVFTSSAEGGKPSGTGADALVETGENSSGEWKLTMTDQAHQNFKVTSVKTYDGKMLYIKYTGAVTGSNEYISAIIKTSSGKVKSYGRLAPASGEKGATVLLNIDGRMSAGDTLCIFNEQCNGDRLTDYTSPLQEIAIPDPEDTDDAVNLVDKDGNVRGIIPTQGSNIYFGKYMQESYDGARFDKMPVKWRVLWNDEAKGQLFLLSDRNLDCKKYNDGYKSTTWEKGPLRAWLNGEEGDSFINTAFSEKEQAVIATTRVRNKKTDDYTPNPQRPQMDGGSDTDDRIFLLSLTDVLNAYYGFANDYDAAQSRVALNTEYTEAIGDAWTGTDSSGFWWLRSPGDGGEYAATVAANGRIIPGGIETDRDKIAVRPATNLNMSSVLFISSADGGRTSVIGPDSLADPGKNTSGDWKVTVKDQSHKNFKVTSITTCDRKMFDIKYSGAAKGDGEYITALIRTGDGKVKYFGNLAAAQDEAGRTKINLSGKMDEGDTLCVFNRQINDDRETDFSSPLQEVSLPAELHDWDAGKVTKKATTAATGVKTYTCKGCSATRTETIGKLKKKANPLAVKGRTAKVKYSKLKKKNQTISRAKAITVTSPQGKLTYKKISVTYTKAKSVKMSKKALKKYKKKAVKKIAINAKTGKVTVKKGLKKGTCKVKVKVKAAGNTNYNASAWKTVTFKIKIN